MDVKSVELKRDFMSPGRSAARSTRAMAATSNPLATETAVAIMREGGNAVDAAIAACAVLALTEPHQTGIGGDCFALIAPRGSDRVIAYNGSGRAPARISLDDVARRMPGGIIATSAEAVTIPGALEAWTRLSADHGRLPLAAVLEPAIYYAEKGVPVHDRVAFDWVLVREKIRASPELAGIYLKQGEPLRAGTVIRFPELARTLRLVAKHGAEGFYTGSIAKSLVATLETRGGVHRLDDFSRHKGEYVSPISASFSGHKVHQCPPNGQGIITLILLGLLDQLPIDPDGPLGPWRAHSLTEAARIAFSIRDRHLADPSFGKFEWSACLHPEVLMAWAAKIRPDCRIAELPTVANREHRDTTYIAVVDEDRTAVSWINSLFESFGSSIVDPDSGVVLHNRGLSFSLDATHANALAPGKRPMHTIIPGMLSKGGKVVMPFGVMGGDFQPVGQALLLSHMLQYGVDLQTAVDLPRLFPTAGEVRTERGIEPGICDHLGRLGHVMKNLPVPVGGAQAIWIDCETGALAGGSDPRKDGCAIGF